MPIKVLYDHNLDLNYINEFTNARLQNVTTAVRDTLSATLTSANKGLVVYDVDKSSLFTWNGSSWDDYLSSSLVLSFKGRVGHVQPTNGDYHITQISGFPDQTGHGTHFLTTSGSNLSWAPLPSILTPEQVQDIIGYILDTDEFNYDDPTPGISIKNIDWDKIINAPAFIVTETDPTVPAHVKSIQAGTNPSHYLGWSGTQWISRKISYSELQGLPVIPPAYTNEMAQDTVAAMILAGTHTGISFNYNDSLNKLSAVVEDAGGREMRFRVGDTDAPSAGATSFNLVDADGNLLTNVKIDFYRERDLQYPIDDYVYNSSGSTVNLTIPFVEGERVIVKIYNIAAWDTYIVGGSVIVPLGLPLTLPFILS